MQGNSLAMELEKYFDYADKTPTKSAFVQQRQKLLPSAFESIFHSFNDECCDPRLFRGYRLFAVDGTDLNVAYNPNAESYQPQGNQKGCNLLHINALYDICNKTYKDIVIQPCQKTDEHGALISMLHRNTYSGKNIVILDRGYEGYNTIAHLLNSDADFVMRVKQNNSAMRHIKPLPMTTLDTTIEPCITTAQTNEDKLKNRIFLRTVSQDHAL